MAEPPILPNSNEPSSANPYAPTYVDTPVPRIAKNQLDSTFWIALAFLLVATILLSVVVFPLSLIGMFASIAAAIRVPLLQRRHAQEVGGFENTLPSLPTPLALLFTSLALNIVFIIVSFIAFAAVCVPGTIAFGFGEASYTVLGVSAVIGLACFGWMFYFSLRLRF